MSAENEARAKCNMEHTFIYSLAKENHFFFSKSSITFFYVDLFRHCVSKYFVKKNCYYVMDHRLSWIMFRFITLVNS